MSKLCEGYYYTIKGEHFYKCKKTGEVISIKNNKFSYETITVIPVYTTVFSWLIPQAMTYQIHCPSCKDIISITNPSNIGELGVAEATISDLYSRGKDELKRFKQGEKLSLEDTIKAHCYDCNGQSSTDCGIDYCSMYPYMPFKDELKLSAQEKTV